MNDIHRFLMRLSLSLLNLCSRLKKKKLSLSNTFKCKFIQKYAVSFEWKYSLLVINVAALHTLKRISGISQIIGAVLGPNSVLAWVDCLILDFCWDKLCNMHKSPKLAVELYQWLIQSIQDLCKNEMTYIWSILCNESQKCKLWLTICPVWIWLSFIAQWFELYKCVY